MAMVPVLNPGEPGTYDLNGMFVGKSIYVCGKIHEDAERFYINLLCKDDVIALHLNPRFDQDEPVVVRNTKNGGWGSEERDNNGNAFPFRRGGLFGITLKCDEEGFEITCNRYKPYARYSHRVPFSSITQVQVGQQCDVIFVCSQIEGVKIPLQVFENLGVPAKIDVPFHNIKQHSVKIVGKPTSDDGRFHINFAGGDKIHFHFNPRMSEKQIVNNTCDDGWGPEERTGSDTFPFQKDIPFQVEITVRKLQFEVKINGHHEFNYGKRMKALNRIRDITVAGDVEIEKFTFY